MLIEYKHTFYTKKYISRNESRELVLQKRIKTCTIYIQKFF